MTPRLTPTELEEIEKIEGKATSGPWKTGRYCTKDEMTVIDSSEQHIGGPACGCDPPEYQEKDAKFIASARQDIPRLTAEVRACWKDNEKLRKTLNDINDLCNAFKTDRIGLSTWVDECSEVIKKALKK